MQQYGTDWIVEELVAAACGDERDARTRYLFTQALYGLVRQAQSEQLLALRADAEKAIGALAAATQRRQTRVMLRRIARDASSGQRSLPFERDEKKGRGA
ncbi:hypothetical protein [Pseudoduganella violacea]|uniref:Uncharacterized protein n=1 Tax=Pseudoduganella violacea TaxID=1715466 RepID=A0A7W5BA52_9BURK|nr:hypothetical protein [Pseudoduganella violacea]MBB3119387.1 hypothetical protein [Pseudoduganella violacea]